MNGPGRATRRSLWRCLSQAGRSVGCAGSAPGYATYRAALGLTAILPCTAEVRRRLRGTGHGVRRRPREPPDRGASARGVGRRYPGTPRARAPSRLPRLSPVRTVSDLWKKFSPPRDVTSLTRIRVADPRSRFQLSFAVAA